MKNLRCVTIAVSSCNFWLLWKNLRKKNMISKNIDRIWHNTLTIQRVKVQETCIRIFKGKANADQSMVSGLANAIANWIWTGDRKWNKIWRRRQRWERWQEFYYSSQWGGSTNRSRLGEKGMDHGPEYRIS